MDTEHSPLPWSANTDKDYYEGIIWSAKGPGRGSPAQVGFGLMLHDQNRADLALIVRAVNCHAALLAALQGLMPLLGHTEQAVREVMESALWDTNYIDTIALPAWRAARAALALATTVKGLCNASP